MEGKEEKIPPGKPRRTWWDNIKLDLKDGSVQTRFFGSGQEQVAGFCEKIMNFLFPYNVGNSLTEQALDSQEGPCHIVLGEKIECRLARAQFLKPENI
jgi:hypothetical protein